MDTGTTDEILARYDARHTLSLEKGKFADFDIMDADLLTAEEK
ncbi:MAG: hypothetical protein ACLFQS_09935 [Bacteroidales bacterium]